MHCCTGVLESGHINLGKMVGVNLCGCKEKVRRKGKPFQGPVTLQALQIGPIRRTINMTATCFVKAFDRGTGPALQSFPGISCHLERHFSQINGS